MTDVDLVATPEDLAAALQSLIKRKHLSLGSVVSRVNDAGGSLGKTTVSNILTGKTLLPRWDTIEQILLACGVANRELAVWEHGYQRASQPAAGEPLSEEQDPIEFGIHKTITTDSSVSGAALTPYVRRAHDRALAEIVAAAADGHSRLVVLLGGSSTGKTRAMWEALAPLRGNSRWRIWHPRSPDRRTALIDGLAVVRSRTVVWLNETQEYLGGDGREGDEKAAVALRDLLRDKSRAPVLVVGTLWQEYYTELREQHASQVRELLDLETLTTVLDVPDSFSGADPADLAAASAIDSRFKYAWNRADDMRITQYIAGGPELLRRYERELTAGAKAIVEIAVDARRMGHRNAIPHGLLACAAHAYMSPREWNAVAANPDWLQTALAEAEHSCKGADGPLTRIVEIPADTGRLLGSARGGQRSENDAEQVYLLADYLDQHARAERAEVIPPTPFWEALAIYAHPQDRSRLGSAARGRGLYRDAAWLWAKATPAGDMDAATELILLLQTVHPADTRPAQWVIDHVDLGNPHVVDRLVDVLQKLKWIELARTLVERAAPLVKLDHPDSVRWWLRVLRADKRGVEAEALARRAVSAISVNAPQDVLWLVEILQDTGWTEQAKTIVDRAVSTVSVNHPQTACQLVKALRSAGWVESAQVLVERVVSVVSVNDPHAVSDLVDVLWVAGWAESASRLVERAVPAVSLADPFAVGWLLRESRNIGLLDQAEMLVDRAVPGVALRDPRAVGWLIGDLQNAGCTEHAQALVERAACAVTLTDSHAVGLLWKDFRDLGWSEPAKTLIERAVPTVNVSDPRGVGWLLRELRQAGLAEQAQMLVERAMPVVAVNEPRPVGWLWDELCSGGWRQEAQALVERAISAVGLDNPHGIVGLLTVLRETARPEEVRTLIEQAVSTVDVDNPHAIGWAVEVLRQAGWTEQTQALIKRAVPSVVVDNPGDVVWLAEVLERAGYSGEARALIERTVPTITFRSTRDVVGLLRVLKRSECVKQEMIERALSVVEFDDLSHVASLIEELQRAGWVPQARSLVERAVHVVPLDYSLEVERLLKALRQAGWTDAADQLVARLPAAGHFDLFLKHVEYPWDYWHGRNADDAAGASSWSWPDLISTGG